MKILIMLSLLFFTSITFSANDSSYNKGLIAYQSGEYEKAFKLFTDAANQGDTDGQYVLGVMYNKGQGVPQDYKQAFKWYSLAAEQGNPRAQFNIGMKYYKGQGVEQDYKQTFKWYSLAAEQGVPRAQNNLGVLYFNGQGVLQDNVYSHMWFNIAASNGVENASEYRDDTANKMTKEQIAKAQELARECVAKDYKGC